MKNSETFNNLIDNAFDFLDKSLEEFETKPKYAAIHFYSAIELFLKARLLHEHWTLILSKPGEADLAKFHQGDFHSINLKDAHTRLKLIVQDGLTDDEYKCFSELGKHRNRMVHFYHAGQSDKQETENIVAEQCRAWHYLCPILMHKWGEIFVRYQGTIIGYEVKMHKYREYLAAKFEQLTSTISEIKKDGSSVVECLCCGFKSMVSKADKLNCLVCHLAFSHNSPTANCGECQGYLSAVLMKNGKWKCVDCSIEFEPEDIKECEYCNNLTSESLENSYWNGCGQCDGEMSRHKDD